MFCEQFLRAIRCAEIPYKENFPLATVCSMHCGGTAALWLLPRSKEELIRLLVLCAEHGVPYRTLGALTNTLPPDGRIEYPLISTVHVTEIDDLGERVTVGCGARLTAVATRFMKQGRDVFAQLSTVPGTVGGAVRGNAGAFGHAMTEYVTEVEVFDPITCRVRRLTAEEMTFSYRESRLKHTDEVLLSATSRACIRDPMDMLVACRRLRDKRAAEQPHEPSLGSVFLKTDDGRSAGALIDACGLKGVRIGDACVSAVHAGFIVNLSAATSSDVRALIYYVKHKVFERYGVRLDCEIYILPKEV